MLLLIAAAAIATAQPVPPGEEPVAPYVQSNANAGTKPFDGTAMWEAFHGKDGVGRIADGFVDRISADPRTAEIMKGQDHVRLRRMVREQFCYILNGGCDYSGRDMKAGHKNLGIQTADFNAIVESLQAAMRQEGVPFATQNRFLAKLAPMKKAIVER